MSESAPSDTCAASHSHAIGQEVASAVAAALKSLADPLRLRMLSAIATDPRGESCVCDLAELADVSQPTVSHHLKVLRDTGMLLSERRGTWVWYRIAPTRQRAVAALLDSFAPAAIDQQQIQTDAPADMDARVTRLGEELADELAGMNRDLVMTIVRESFAGLVRSAKVTQHLIPLTERFARQRLADLVRDRTAGVPQVLFVCVQNAGRSQLAAAFVNQLAEGKVIARSAGSLPAAEVHPHVRTMLSEIEGTRDSVAAFPKPLTDDAVRAADVVVTMGCGDVCPIIPGVRYEDWSVGDPALASPEGVDAIRDDIENRVRHLLATITT